MSDELGHSGRGHYVRDDDSEAFGFWQVQKGRRRHARARNVRERGTPHGDRRRDADPHPRVGARPSPASTHIACVLFSRRTGWRRLGWLLARRLKLGVTRQIGTTYTGGEDVLGGGHPVRTGNADGH